MLKSGKGYSLVYDDGVTGLIANGTAVSGKIALEKPFYVTNLEELEELGIDKESTGANANVYKCVSEFYCEAPKGTTLYIMLVSVGTGIGDILDKENDYAVSLMEYSKGCIRTLMVKVTDEQNYEPTMEDGLDSEVYNAIGSGQELAEFMSNKLEAPIIVVLEGRHWTGRAEDLADITEMGCNKVSVVIGDTVCEDGHVSTGACVGLVCGRIAAIPVQRSIARVKDGCINYDGELYLGDKVASNTVATVVSDNGFVCPRVFAGYDGYYWSDDNVATDESEDCSSIARVRVMNKASRLLNIILHERLNDEIAVSSSGFINSAWVMGLETEIKSVLLQTMGEAGNIGSVDETEDGVEVYIDLEQDVVSNDGFEVEVAIMPYGYGKYISASLRFDL